MQTILITIQGNHVAPRFDLTPEVWLGNYDPQTFEPQGRILVLPQPSADKVCQMVIDEGVSIVICGGIEAQYHEYLRWKRIRVYDSVLGKYADAVQALAAGRLQSEMIFPFGC
ncbi:MAG: dinitrogenase iron-molybdenum cofactor biosynthesis protein [Desulfohalobiaceae bacterium]|nr:dinitrogenase iron-molybdenum cofactor biosynthesis protein [Desulfohalobiaceae bacterium]